MAVAAVIFGFMVMASIFNPQPKQCDVNTGTTGVERVGVTDTGSVEISRSKVVNIDDLNS